ncbi:MAG: YbjN domain-containing protein [Pseudonocardiaceae bacterium]
MSLGLDGVIAGTLDEAGLAYEHRGPGSFLITLPGTTKLQTSCWVLVGQHGVLVEAFVCRRPDEAHEDVYRWLLQRNARLYGVHYTLDKAGDIYLIGRFAHHAITAQELDRVLGQVVEAADGDFNTVLEIGFASSIRREWDWRVARGESLANLAAFEHLVR